MQKFSPKSAEWIKDQWYEYVLHRAEQGLPVRESEYYEYIAQLIGQGVTAEDIEGLFTYRKDLVKELHKTEISEEKKKYYEGLQGKFKHLGRKSK